MCAATRTPNTEHRLAWGKEEPDIKGQPPLNVCKRIHWRLTVSWLNFIRKRTNFILNGRRAQRSSRRHEGHKQKAWQCGDGCVGCDALCVCAG